MSHELRTPLNAIIGFSEIMESAMFGPLGAEKYTEYSRDIRESGEYLLDVINDILDMSKIEAGGIRLTPEVVALEPVLADCLRVVSTRAGEKHLKLDAKVDPDIQLNADRRAIKQIALNLLSNAVKFTPDGGAVTVRGRRRGGMVTIAIADNGIGIPKDALRKLGRPFEQVESQLTKRHQGSGLGLAIAKSLAEMHGGVMRIRSKLGQGTMVVVRLPLQAKPPARRGNGRVAPAFSLNAWRVTQAAFPKIRTKHSRTWRWVSSTWACSAGKSGRSAARARRPSTPALAVFGSNAAGRQSRRICVKSWNSRTAGRSTVGVFRLEQRRAAPPFPACAPSRCREFPASPRRASVADIAR